MDSKYLTIYNEIISDIENGKILPNTKLPSESELMESYNVSRDTVRKSLNLLESNGYIQKVKGKGSFVIDFNRLGFPVSGLTSFKELTEKLSLKSSTILQELELIKPDKFLMNQLNAAEEDDIWKVVRVRKIGDKKIILDKDFINKKFVSCLTKEICEASIYEYLENTLGLKISFAKKEITVQPASEEDKKYLDLENFNMVAVVKNHIYLEDMTLFQYTESRHRPDKFKFVGFARRK